MSADLEKRIKVLEVEMFGGGNATNDMEAAVIRSASLSRHVSRLEFLMPDDRQLGGTLLAELRAAELLLYRAAYAFGELNDKLEVLNPQGREREKQHFKDAAEE